MSTPAFEHSCFTVGLADCLFLALHVARGETELCMKKSLCLFFLTQEDFHYEYTKCDSAGGRWLVSVPNSEDAKCTGGPSEAPVRGKRCGQFTLHYIIDITLHYCGFCLSYTHTVSQSCFNPFAAVVYTKYPNCLFLHQCVDVFAHRDGRTS